MDRDQMIEIACDAFGTSTIDGKPTYSRLASVIDALQKAGALAEMRPEPCAVCGGIAGWVPGCSCPAVPAPASGEMTVFDLQAEIDAILGEVHRAYPKAQLAVWTHAAPHQPFTAYFRREATNYRSDWSWCTSGRSVEDVLAEARAYLATLPVKWSAADVAATLGIPLCEWCDEAVATHDAHDPSFDPSPSVRVCEPCLEKAWDRQNEQRAEDAA